MRISVIIPAYNEERYLAQTMVRVLDAGKHFQNTGQDNSIEIIVVDNDSDDRTAELAAQFGCRVVEEKEHSIGKVRNTGAREATGDVLMFIDADTLVPVDLFARIARKLEDPHCIGGAVDVCYKPSKRLIRYYLLAWRLLGLLAGMAQGAAQFCRQPDFQEMGGYDESLYMGEDVHFYWTMRRWARQRSGYVTYIDDVSVIPSCRRFDQWPGWKTVLMTNPILVYLFRRTKKAWPGWYLDRPK
jgi:glycosyltransferase involved in cell wall biosynthesis